MGADVNRILMGLAGIAVILAHRLPDLLEPPGDPAARGRRGLRPAGGHRRARPLHRAGAGPGSQGMSRGVANLLGYAGKGTEFLFGRLASDPLGQNLRDRRRCR